MTRLLLFRIVTALEVTFHSAAASAQLPSPAATQGPPAAAATQESPERDPHRYLAIARQQLQAVPAQTLSGDAKKKLNKLREDFERLATNYEQRSLTPANSASAAATASSSPSPEAIDWKLKFDAVERDLVAILGAGSLLGGDTTPAIAGTSGVAPPLAPETPSQATATPAQPLGAASRASQTPSSQPAVPASPPTQPAAGMMPPGQAMAGSSAAQPAATTGVEPGVAGASTGTDQAIGLAGVAVAEIGVKNLDPAVRAQLEEVRKSVELFYDATNSVGRP